LPNCRIAEDFVMTNDLVTRLNTKKQAIVFHDHCGPRIEYVDDKDAKEAAARITELEAENLKLRCKVWDLIGDLKFMKVMTKIGDTENIG
jgi:hypothetical protein